MSLTRWNPYRELVSMQNILDRLFGDFSARQGAWGSWEDRTLSLPVDLVENDREYLLTAELPGIKPEDVDISITGSTLTIKGEFTEEQESEQKNVHFRERRYGKFQRSATLPNSVDADHIEAVFENGVLRLTLPKQEQAKPKQIPVKTK
jgi:HSP20 family protein